MAHNLIEIALWLSQASFLKHLIKAKSLCSKRAASNRKGLKLGAGGTKPCKSMRMG